MQSSITGAIRLAAEAKEVAEFLKVLLKLCALETDAGKYIKLSTLLFFFKVFRSQGCNANLTELPA